MSSIEHRSSYRLFLLTQMHRDHLFLLGVYYRSFQPSQTNNDHDNSSKTLLGCKIAQEQWRDLQVLRRNPLYSARRDSSGSSKARLQKLGVFWSCSRIGCFFSVFLLFCIHWFPLSLSRQKTSTSHRAQRWSSCTWSRSQSLHRHQLRTSRPQLFHRNDLHQTYVRWIAFQAKRLKCTYFSSIFTTLLLLHRRYRQSQHFTRFRPNHKAQKLPKSWLLFPLNILRSYE